MNYLNFLYHFMILSYAPVTVKSMFSQFGQYKCIIISVASCIKYIVVAMVVPSSLWITHCQSPPWSCTRLVTCTTSAALVTTSPHHLIRVVIMVRVRVVTLVVMVVRSLLLGGAGTGQAPTI